MKQLQDVEGKAKENLWSQRVYDLMFVPSMDLHIIL